MGKPSQFPAQSQKPPGREHRMRPEPEIIRPGYRGSGKLTDKIALITGGDSGIGRSVAVHFAREGANVAITYLEEDDDANKTRELVEAEGRRCLLFSGDLQEEAFCRQAVRRTINELGRLDIVVNNAGMQFPKDDVDQISSEQLQATFRTNIFAYFYVVQEAVHYLPEGGVIINTGSVTAYRGSAHLIDYSSTKGAIASFTRSLAGSLAKKKVRVNGVAPGPIWTPLIVSTFDGVTDFGQDTPMGRAGQPSEVGPAYVFLASEDSSYVTGQLLHVNGGDYFGQ